MSFFGRDKRTPNEIAKDQTRAISAQIRQEKRLIDRQINQCEREVQRLSIDLRKQASSMNKDALRILAKGIVRVKHNKSQLYSAKANLDTIESAVKTQLTNIKLAGVMQRSTEVVRSLSELMKIEQFQSITEEFSKELMKMGIINDMTNEVLSTVMDDNDLEEETNEEIEKVLKEVLMPKLTVPSKEYLNFPAIPSTTEPVDVDNETDEFQWNLEASRN